MQVGKYGFVPDEDFARVSREIKYRDELTCLQTSLITLSEDETDFNLYCYGVRIQLHLRGS